MPQSLALALTTLNLKAVNSGHSNWEERQKKVSIGTDRQRPRTLPTNPETMIERIVIRNCGLRNI